MEQEIRGVPPFFCNGRARSADKKEKSFPSGLPFTPKALVARRGAFSTALASRSASFRFIKRAIVGYRTAAARGQQKG